METRSSGDDAQRDLWDRGLIWKEGSDTRVSRRPPS